MIIKVNYGDTLFSLSQKYGVPVSKIIADNGIYDESPVVGQSLILQKADEDFIPMKNTLVSSISNSFGIGEKELFRNNYILGGKNDVPEGTYIVISYIDTPSTEKIIGGYAYDFISAKKLSSVINYLTYIMPFTYGFTENSELIKPNDEFILNMAKESGVKALMHVSTLTKEGNFDSNLPSLIFSDSDKTSLLIDNIINEVNGKEYSGVDIDFEFLPAKEKSNYVNFVRLLSDRLHQNGKILVIAVPPKTSDSQRGLLVEGIDYRGLGEIADYILIMAYEYGYRFGPPLAIAPINQITKVLDYALTEVPSEKILLGLSNYGYDWTLPFVMGKSDAPSISTVEAIELAKKYGSEILFDEISMAPYFFYTDNEGNEHEVWFEDARSFKAKMDLIKNYNLAGGFIWDLMRDNPQGFVTINSLVKII